MSSMLRDVKSNFQLNFLATHEQHKQAQWPAVDAGGDYSSKYDNLWQKN